MSVVGGMSVQRTLRCDARTLVTKHAHIESFSRPPTAFIARRKTQRVIMCAQDKGINVDCKIPLLSKTWSKVVLARHLQKQYRRLQSKGNVHVAFLAGALGGAGGGAGHGGNSGKGGGGSGGQDGWSNGPTAQRILANEGHESSDFAEQVILLDVRGMKCGGCVSHVKRILEEQPNVSQASINLTTETALVRIKTSKGAGGASEAPAGGRGDLSKLAEQLAQVLTDRGFPSAVSTRPLTAHQQQQQQ